MVETTQGRLKITDRHKAETDDKERAENVYEMRTNTRMSDGAGQDRLYIVESCKQTHE